MIRKLFLLLLLFVAVGVGAELPERPMVRVFQVDVPNGVDIWAENEQGADLTLTLRLTRQENLIVEPPLPETFDLPGREKVLLAKVRRHNDSQPWNVRYAWNCNWGTRAGHHDPRVVYRLPYSTGRSFKLIQGFHGGFSHTGDDEYALDFGLPEGEPVLAARGGTVVSAVDVYSEGAPQPYYRNRVNCIMIKHDDNTIGEYDHFRHQGIMVREGQRVEAGELLGFAGRTGYATGPHLHFVVYRAVDGYKRQSFPVRFHVGGLAEPVTLEEGKVYTAP